MAGILGSADSEWIETYPEVDQLPEEQRREIFRVNESGGEKTVVERYLRDVFLYTIFTKSSDVHIVGKKAADEGFSVRVSVRTFHGMVNCAFNRTSAGKFFRSKIFDLTSTPQGASTPETLSARFDMTIPREMAVKYGLKPFDNEDYQIGVRVSYIKLVDGFKFTCRIIDEQKAPKFHELNLSYALSHEIRRLISAPTGLYLVSGPTGSGKSTLLFAILNLLNDGQHAISTIEDPVEYRLRGDGPIGQVNVGGELTFPRALRELVRQDPDIIYVGEIRDVETMDIALAAAGTGHRVFATIHADTAADTITRAIDLTKDKARDAARLAECLKTVIAARLISVYEGPSKTRIPNSAERDWLDCNGMAHISAIEEVTGNKRVGKQPVIEALTVSVDMKREIRKLQPDKLEIFKLAAAQLQYETLAQSGVRAVLEGKAKLEDCMNNLDVYLESMQVQTTRVKLSKDHSISLCAASTAVDNYFKARDDERPYPLDHFVALAAGDSVERAEVVDIAAGGHHTQTGENLVLRLVAHGVPVEVAAK